MRSYVGASRPPTCLWKRANPLGSRDDFVWGQGATTSQVASEENPRLFRNPARRNFVMLRSTASLGCRVPSSKILATFGSTRSAASARPTSAGSAARPARRGPSL